MLYDFTARMHEDDIVYIHPRAQQAGIALKTKYSPLVDIAISLSDIFWTTLTKLEFAFIDFLVKLSSFELII